MAEVDVDMIVDKEVHVLSVVGQGRAAVVRELFTQGKLAGEAARDARYPGPRFTGRRR